MFVAAAEETQNDLINGRGDAYCGMLNCSYNLSLRKIPAIIPEYPVGTAEDIVKMMQKEEDSNFMAQCRDVVARSGKSLNVTTPTHKITRESLTALTNMIDGDELETACFLMSKTTWNEWAAQGNEVFDIGAWDVVRHGYKEEEILGRKCFVTLKEDLIPNNEIWAFCSPEYLGYMFTLDDAKFWVDSRADEIFFKGWEFIGCGFGNIRGMAMITIS
jgi:hypothetical protein